MRKYVLLLVYVVAATIGAALTKQDTYHVLTLMLIIYIFLDREDEKSNR